MQKKSLLCISIFTANIILTSNGYAKFEVEGELYQHPLFLKQAQHLAKTAEIQPVPLVHKKLTEAPAQTGWVKSMMSIFTTSETPPVAFQTDIPSEQNEGWGSWIYDSVKSSATSTIKYVGQVAYTSVQTLFYPFEEASECALVQEQPTQEQGACRLTQSRPETVVVSEQLTQEKSTYLLTRSKSAYFDTLTYVGGMLQVIMGGWDNADPRTIEKIASKDQEAAIKYAGTQKKVGPARRRARLLGELDQSKSQLAALRQAKKSYAGKRALRKSLFIQRDSTIIQ